MPMKIAAGTIIPPTAAAVGTPARPGSRRPPATNSGLISSPTTKKKVASRPSAAHADTDSRRCSDSGPIATCETARYAADHGELAHSRAAPEATNNSTPPTVSFRRISANRCDSDHDPRVRSRRLGGIGRSVVTRAELKSGCPALPSTASLRLERREVWSAVAPPVPTQDDGRGSSAVAMQRTFSRIGRRQDTVWISPDAHDGDVPLGCAGRTDRGGVSRRQPGLRCARGGAVAGHPTAARAGRDGLRRYSGDDIAGVAGRPAAGARIRTGGSVAGRCAERVDGRPDRRQAGRKGGCGGTAQAAAGHGDGEV